MIKMAFGRWKNRQVLQKRDTMEDAPDFDMDHWPDTNIHLDRINGGWSFMG